MTTPPTAEILSQGDEIITGQTIDSNAAWIAEYLTELGFTIQRHTSVGDFVEDIRNLVNEATSRCAVCICTGGLGPTEDDLTAQAVAEAFQRPLQLDETALAQMTAFFKRANRIMVAANRKQAYLPQGAIRLDNNWGTAPGFALKEKGTWLICLPGVPREMKPMMQQRVQPLLMEQFQLNPGHLVTLRTVGIGESVLQEQIGSFQHSKVILSYRTMHPENQIKLRFPGSFPEEAMQTIVKETAERIGHSFIFSIEGMGERGGSLIEVIAHQLKTRHEQIAVAEVSTGGYFAATCSALADWSDWLVQSVVLSPQACLSKLGIEQTLIHEHRTVSEAVVKAMAEAIRHRNNTTYGLANTPTQPTTESEGMAGIVYIGLATPHKTYAHPLQVFGSSGRIQRTSTAESLDLLRRYLAGLLD